MPLFASVFQQTRSTAIHGVHELKSSLLDELAYAFLQLAILLVIKCSQIGKLQTNYLLTIHLNTLFISTRKCFLCIGSYINEYEAILRC